MTEGAAAASSPRPITPAEIERYELDGVVCLRGVLPRLWLDELNAAVEVALARREDTADLTEMARSIRGSPPGHVRAGVEASSRGRFFAGTDHWRRQPEFRRFACDSPLPGFAASLMRSRKVNLYEDSLLVKEPGAQEATAFHQDLAYFHAEGEQICTFWCPLDAIRRENGAVDYVRGSHRWGRVFKPNLFVSDQPIPGTVGETVPDIRAQPESYDLLTFDMQPGDVTAHHARTLHGAGGNRSLDRRRRAVSVRYCGDDARVLLRPGAPRKPHQERARDGSVLDGEDCPVVWRA